MGIRGDLGLTLVSTTACRVDLESNNTNLFLLKLERSPACRGRLAGESKETVERWPSVRLAGVGCLEGFLNLLAW